MEQLQWTTQQRTVNDLIPLEINPRKITEARRMKMIESLQRFNLVDIPVVDLDGVVISGHQRLRALQAIGRGEELIDVRIPNRKLTAKELKEYNLLANSHFGEFDFEILETDFADVDFDLVPIDLKSIEFENSETFEKQMDSFFKKKEAKELKAEEDDFDVPEGGSETDIVPGDLFEIGEHRLLCGDSTDSESVSILMGGGICDLYITDPPYGVGYVGKTKEKLIINNDRMSKDGTHELWRDAFNTALIFLKEGAPIYATVPAGLLQLGFMQVMVDAECLHQCMVWNKMQMVLGHSDYHYAHEPILYGWKPGKHYFTDDRTKTTVLDFRKPLRNADHPTMKPVELWSELIKNSSQISDIVYDSFLGSGTTMVAAHQLSRKCYGMELDPKYCQVIIDRMRKLDPSLIIKRNGEVMP